MKRVIKCRLTNTILFLICLGFLTAIFMPAPGHTLSVTSSGTASIDWSLVTFSQTLNFIDPVVGDTRTSFSGAQVQLNGVQTDFANGSDFNTVPGPWANTSIDASISNATGSAIGHADTGLYGPPPGAPVPFDPANPLPANRIFASVNNALNTPGSAALTGEPNQANAALTGIFTSATGGPLTVTVPYSLALSLFSDTAFGNAASDVFVGLFLFGIDPISGLPFDDPLASAPAELHNFISGITSFSASSNGILNLSFSNLLANTPYEFDAVATAQATAATPEPGTLFLLGSGLIGLGTTLRRRFKKEGVQKSSS